MSRQRTLILAHIIQASLTISPSAMGTHHVCSYSPACPGNLSYLGLMPLAMYIVLFQVEEDLEYTLRLLVHHCSSTSDLAQELPHLALLACAYLNAVALAARKHHDSDVFRALLDVLSSACNNSSREFTIFDSATDPEDSSWWWDGFFPAVEYIHRKHADHGLSQTLFEGEKHPTASTLR